MKDIMKLDKSLAESGQVVEGMKKQLKKKEKNKLVDFLACF